MQSRCHALPVRVFTGIRLILLLALLVAAMPIGVCWGQTFSASLSGVVTDPSGTAVPNAAIEIRNTATNDVRQINSGPDGSYQITTLNPGAYDITAQVTGFKKFIQRNVVLTAGTAANLTIRLELGQVEQSVEVTEQAVLLDTQSANNAAALNADLVSALPTSTRSPLNFVYALAGTIQSPMSDTSTTQDQMFSMFGLQGGRGGNAEILLDGAPATAIDWGGLMVSPTVDAVQEMQVVRNTYDAQYGKSGGGIVSLVSKGGSNSFHGLAYDYLRNDNLDANSWSNNRAGWNKGELKRNQFGGNIGGPIWKRKNLFFFAAYEGLRQPSVASSGEQTMPTDLERQGDFSKTFNVDGTPQIVYDPFSTRKVVGADGAEFYTRDPLNGNKVPTSLLNPIGQKVAALWPKPNRTGVGPRLINNYFEQAGSGVFNDKVEYRVDWAHNEKHRIFGRVSQRIRQTSHAPDFYGNGATSGSAYDMASPGFHATINDTLTPSPTWVINALIAASRWAERQVPVSFGRITHADLGLRPSDYQSSLMPKFSVTDYAGLGPDYSHNEYIRTNNTAEVNVTKMLTSHTLKFGGEFQVLLINNRENTGGSFGFGRDFTACDPAEGGGPCVAVASLGGQSNVSGNALAGLLMGVGGGSTSLDIDRAMAQHYFGFYAEDSWRATSRLTVNLGLRYENQRPVTERFNRMAGFNMNVKSPLDGQVPIGRPLFGGYQFASSSDRTIWPGDNKNFAPRIGLAYRVNDKLVARAGFGIFYGPSTAMISFDRGNGGMFPGYRTDTYWQNSVGGLGYTPQGTLSNPFPNGQMQPTADKAGLLTKVFQGNGEAWLYGPHPTGYKSHFSLDVQYELKAGSVIEVGYTGWRARKLMYGNPNINVNQLPTEFLKLGDELNKEVPNPFYGIGTEGYWTGETIPYQQLLRPFPQFGNINVTRSLPGATANFDGLNVKFQHQLSSGLNLLSTYQYSKTMDNGSEDFLGWAMGNSWRDSYNTKLDYSVSAHDIPHSFVTALVYDLPVGKGKKFASSMPAVADQILGGWQLSPIVRLNSGMPVWSINYNTWWNPLNEYGFPGHERPNLVGNPVPKNRTPEHWIEASAFEPAAQYTYGNAPRYIDALRQGSERNVDLSVGKAFHPTERTKIQFRAEFLNLFNTPQYGGSTEWGEGIGRTLTWGDFGVVNGTKNPPRFIQFGLRFEY